MFFYFILFHSFNIISLLLPQSFCIGDPSSLLGTESVILFRLQSLNVNVHERSPEGHGANFYARQGNGSVKFSEKTSCYLNVMAYIAIKIGSTRFVVKPEGVRQCIFD